jgi:Ca2+-binding RTX toxin-like protein
MARNFDNPFSANVIGLWDFRDGAELDDTGLDDGIAQDGSVHGDTGFGGGWLLADGKTGRFEVSDHGDDSGNDDPFNLTEGSIVTEFRQFDQVGTQPNTVVSRGEADNAGQEGFFEIRVTGDGAVEVLHADGGQSVTLSSGAGFFNPDDVLKVSYSWSGIKGPQLQVINVTQGTIATDSSDVMGLTLDVTDDDGNSFSIAARETDDGDYDQYLNGAVDYVAVLDSPVIGQGNGIVDGSAGDDLIDLAYTGDPEGDVIDGGDAILPGQAPDDDIVDAGAGDDTIEAGVGDDAVYAGSGADLVDGESGDDVIYGDSNADGGGAGGWVRENLEWDLAPNPYGPGDIPDGADLSGSFTQNTGNVDVTFTVLNESPGVDTEFSDVDQFITNIDTGLGGADADDNSGMQSVLNGQSNSADYQLSFSNPVLNMSFRINDIDGDGIVRVQAFDADGNQITVNLSGGSNLTMSDTDGVAGDDTADSNGGYADPNNSGYSVLVTIPGPIERVVIAHDQDGGATSGIVLTDVFFDVPLADTGDDGDDTLSGGAGDDLIYGEGGDDSIYGGDGSDTVEGGDGDDMIDTRGALASQLPDRGFAGYGVIPPIPADPDIYDDRDVVDGGAGDDTILTGDDVDIIHGGAGDDSIDAGLDDDTIHAGDGDDFVVGGEGSDVIEGGGGDDLIYGGLDPSFPDSLNIRDDGSDGPPDPDPTNGMDVIDGGDGNDTIHGQDDDDILRGGAGDDVLDGDIDDDQLFGDEGNDLLLGGQGEDTLDGGTGNDVLLSGEGADFMYGGDDQDTIGAGIGDVAEGGEGGIDLDTLIANGLATVTYDGGDPASEAGTITFYNPDLTIAGTMEFSEIERVLVVDPNGSILPGGGPGTTSRDGIVDGTDGDDIIDLAYTGDPEGDMIDNDDAVLPLVDEQDIVLAGAGDDYVTGVEDSDVIFGGDGEDTLEGNAGGDAIDGGAGDDVIDGGAGGDILVGGEGDDTLSGSVLTAGDTGDLMFGNTGDDTFIEIGQGEVIDGGEDDDGLDIDTLDLTGSAEAVNAGGSLRVDFDPLNSEDGVVSYFDADDNLTGTTSFFNIEDVVCFTPNTLIATPKGERRVQDLAIGDRVITRDNGIQEIRWVGNRPIGAREMELNPHLKPVLIRQGALGNGLPERDMMLSANHRVLVANDKTTLYFEDREVLVAAKHLTGLEGVDIVGVSSTAYIHFLFDQHEVVLSDGAWSESFQPGDHSLKGIGNAQRNEIFELFPELETREGLDSYQSARRSLKKHEARLLTR